MNSFAVVWFLFFRIIEYIQFLSCKYRNFSGSFYYAVTSVMRHDSHVSRMCPICNQVFVCTTARARHTGTHDRVHTVSVIIIEWAEVPGARAPQSSKPCHDGPSDQQLIGSLQWLSEFSVMVTESRSRSRDVYFSNVCSGRKMNNQSQHFITTIPHLALKHSNTYTFLHQTVSESYLPVSTCLHIHVVRRLLLSRTHDIILW